MLHQDVLNYAQELHSWLLHRQEVRGESDYRSHRTRGLSRFGIGSQLGGGRRNNATKSMDWPKVVHSVARSQSDRVPHAQTDPFF